MPLISAPNYGPLVQPQMFDPVGALQQQRQSKGQSLLNQAKEAEIKKSRMLQGISFGPNGQLTPEGAQSFAAADPMGYQKYLQDTQKATQEQEEAKRKRQQEGAVAFGQAAAPLVGKPRDQQEAALPGILASLQSGGYTAPEGVNVDNFSNLVFGAVPVEKQLPKKEDDPNWQTVERPDGLYQVNPQTGVSRKVSGIAPKPIAEPKEPKGQIVTLADGSLALVDPTTGTMKPVVGADGKPAQSKNPGMLSGKQLENAKNKQSLLSTARMQLEQVKAKREQIRNSLASGAFGQGLLPTQFGKEFDAAVDPLRVTIRSLTRTPGEGSMSDYESRLAQAQLPTRDAYESVTDQQIQQMDDYINQLETGYEGLGAARVKTAPAGIRKPDVKALRTKYKY